METVQTMVLVPKENEKNYEKCIKEENVINLIEIALKMGNIEKFRNFQNQSNYIMGLNKLKADLPNVDEFIECLELANINIESIINEDVKQKLQSEYKKAKLYTKISPIELKSNKRMKRSKIWIT